jgi:hypothetical protein
VCRRKDPDNLMHSSQDSVPLAAPFWHKLGFFLWERGRLDDAALVLEKVLTG